MSSQTNTLLHKALFDSRTRWFGSTGNLVYRGGIETSTPTNMHTFSLWNVSGLCSKPVCLCIWEQRGSVVNKNLAKCCDPLWVFYVCFQSLALQSLSMFLLDPLVSWDWRATLKRTVGRLRATRVNWWSLVVQRLSTRNTGEHWPMQWAVSLLVPPKLWPSW